MGRAEFGHLHGDRSQPCQLAYNSVAAWLEGDGSMPGPVAAVKGLDANLQIQPGGSKAEGFPARTRRA